jgi:hypothetical protein
MIKKYLVRILNPFLINKYKYSNKDFINYKNLFFLKKLFKIIIKELYKLIIKIKIL